MSSVTLEVLGGYLDRMDWPAPYVTQDEPGEREGYLGTFWTTAGGQVYRLVIDPQIERGLIVFRSSLAFGAPLDDPPTVPQLELLAYLSYRNYHIMLGKWTRDYDGEIVFSLVYGIDDGLPFERFQRLLLLAIREIESQAPAFAALLDGSKRFSDLGPAHSEPTAVPASPAPDRPASPGDRALIN